MNIVITVTYTSLESADSNLWSITLSAQLYEMPQPLAGTARLPSASHLTSHHETRYNLQPSFCHILLHEYKELKFF